MSWTNKILEMRRNRKLKDKALEYIEKCCLVYVNSDKNNKENVQKIIDNIYRYAHCVQNRCKNPHENWKKELESQNWSI